MPCVAIALALLTACATPVLCQSDLHMVPPDGDVRSRSSDEACKVMPALRIAAPALSGLDGWTGDADHWADALGDEHPVVADGSLCPSSCVRPPGADLPPVTMRHGPLWRYVRLWRYGWKCIWSGLFTLGTCGTVELVFTVTLAMVIVTLLGLPLDESPTQAVRATEAGRTAAGGAADAGNGHNTGSTAQIGPAIVDASSPIASAALKVQNDAEARVAAAVRNAEARVAAAVRNAEARVAAAERNAEARVAAANARVSAAEQRTAVAEHRVAAAQARANAQRANAVAAVIDLSSPGASAALKARDDAEARTGAAVRHATRTRAAEASAAEQRTAVAGHAQRAIAAANAEKPRTTAVPSAPAVPVCTTRGVAAGSRGPFSPGAWVMGADGAVSSHRGQSQYSDSSQGRGQSQYSDARDECGQSQCSDSSEDARMLAALDEVLARRSIDHAISLVGAPRPSYRPACEPVPQPWLPPFGMFRPSWGKFARSESDWSFGPDEAPAGGGSSGAGDHPDGNAGGDRPDDDAGGDLADGDEGAADEPIAHRLASRPNRGQPDRDRFEPGGPNAGSSRAGLPADSLLDAPVPEGLVAPLTPLAPALMDAPVPDALEAPILPMSLDACAAPTERAADVRAATAISLLWAACASADAGATCLAGRTAGAADAACLWQHRRRGSRGGRRAPSRRLTTFS